MPPQKRIEVLAKECLADRAYEYYGGYRQRGYYMYSCVVGQSNYKSYAILCLPLHPQSQTGWATGMQIDKAYDLLHLLLENE